MAAALLHPAALPAPLHPADLIALESMAWALLHPEQSARGLHVYQQATVEGAATQAYPLSFPLPPGHRVYRTSSWS
jgi:hypothetical protein